MATIRRGAQKVAPVQTRPAKSGNEVAGKASITATKMRTVRGGGKEELGTNSGAVELESRDIDPSRLGNVRIGLGMTINLGNFESMRVDVSVQLPCSDDEQDIIDTKERAAILAGDFLEEEKRHYIK